MFFTSTDDKLGKECFDSKYIAYMKGKELLFYCDIISVLGADVFTSLTR